MKKKKKRWEKLMMGCVQAEVEEVVEKPSQQELSDKRKAIQSKQKEPE